VSLRDKLREILPALLPAREEEAIKGTELIARVRAVLGEEYSDGSIRSQFSFIALEPDSCLARVPNGQGYYLRQEGELLSLHNMFESEANASREGNDPLHKALALAVRLYDTAGLGVFVYPVDNEGSWAHPDLVAVHWPPGSIDAAGAYILADDTPQQASFCAVCAAMAWDAESCRLAFFRAMACGLWAQEAELLLLGEPPLAVQEELSRLASRYGVGIRILGADEETLDNLPRADEIFRAKAADARALLAGLPQLALAPPRRQERPLQGEQDLPDTAAALDWANACIARGRIEPYEFRVAVN